MKKNPGFTLVEIMIVVIVIVVLALIAYVAYDTVSRDARDSARIATLKQLESAIELYYADHEQYPTIAHGRGDETSCGSQTENWGHCDRWNTLINLLTPYAEVGSPEDYSSATNGNYYYSYDSQSDDGYQTYGLMVYLEGSGGANDGGYYSNAYELGQNPEYCVDTYSGSNEDWLNTSGAYNQRCLGGN